MTKQNLEEKIKRFNFSVKSHLSYDSRGSCQSLKLLCNVHENDSIKKFEIHLYNSDIVPKYDRDIQEKIAKPRKLYAKAEPNYIGQRTEELIQQMKENGIHYLSRDILSFEVEDEKESYCTPYYGDDSLLSIIGFSRIYFSVDQFADAIKIAMIKSERKEVK